MDDPVVTDILAVALGEFARLGLAGARIDAIAAKTRTSKRMIYYHFGSKEKLYEAVLAYGFASVRREETGQKLAQMEPMAALAAFAQEAFDMHADHPLFVYLVMQENLRGANSVNHAVSIPKSNNDTLQWMQQTLARGQASGVMRLDVTAMDIYTNMVAMCFHNVSNRLSFSAGFGLDPDSPELRKTRRASIVDAVLRYAKA